MAFETYRSIPAKSFLLLVPILIPLLLVTCNHTYYRAITHLYPNLETNRIFPERKVETSSPVSNLEKKTGWDLPEKLTFQTMKGEETLSSVELLRVTNTNTLIVIKDGKVLYENYWNGFKRDTIQTSFSMAKSIASTLIGIAIGEGKIQSVNDPVIRYIPELKDRGIDLLTIRDLMMMSTGIDYTRMEETFFLFIPFSNDVNTFYGNHLRRLVLSLHGGKDAVGKLFNYNDFYPLIEGMVLERATKMSISQYTQEKLWKPMGMEADSSWSLDSEEDGLERAHVGLNARAMDFARIGLLFLNQGVWNKRKILSKDWVLEATSPDPNDQREWKVFSFWKKSGGYYKYHWWGMKNADGTYDYMARGNLGQIIFVSPSKNAVIVRLGEEPKPKYQWPFIAKAILDRIPK
ncbi:class C beta-lactamase-related serine hydrolase [Leptospira langatensis]|uniref:Class C beta-lactamase-related serine hydrolase n=1 Tax=Leptospira langatensis TaxID=2484983 RepID=A0A5F1ZVK0_9LEPT|nr:serine hydrolase [Leptospira langatensis]TGK00090.1 class C beta-lactamase-related serine hydrolase [Leptospira langatensis]TGL42724.1 class C beta-lactamase-related serine hydrolase [Leptospira langatensis]